MGNRPAMILIPTKNPEDWIHLLVDPDLHWKSDNLSKDEGRLTILHRKIYLT